MGTKKEGVSEGFITYSTLVESETDEGLDAFIDMAHNVMHELDIVVKHELAYGALEAELSLVFSIVLVTILTTVVVLINRDALYY